MQMCPGFEVGSFFYDFPMDPYKDLKNFNISLEVRVNVLQRAVHGSL